MDMPSGNCLKWFNVVGYVSVLQEPTTLVLNHRRASALEIAKL